MTAPTHEGTALDLMSALRLYELSRRDAMIDNWRGCHSTSAEGPWYVAEHSDLAALLARCTALDAENVRLREAMDEASALIAMDNDSHWEAMDILEAALASSAVPPTETTEQENGT